ncbi:MAG: hypothetical protein ACJ8AI_17490 [Rhodopila sp.]
MRTLLIRTGPADVAKRGEGGCARAAAKPPAKASKVDLRVKYTAHMRTSPQDC